MSGRQPAKHSLNIVPTVSLSAFAYLFSEYIQYLVDRANSIGELEERLDKVGYDVGVRVLELLSYREKVLRRKTDVLDVLRLIHGPAWQYLFGKTADDLQQAAHDAEEYYIRDYDLLVCRYISIPRSYEAFNPGALVAGLMRGMLDSAGFPAKVSAVLERYKERPRPVTTFIVRMEPAVRERTAYLEAAKR
ncbi:Trafficking protein particle complex subunit 5 [Tetrabaena socialis]|uniref:Trafficking protein particle complex subunit n=1 Tax=Tetrabaena socialis TaxID=47790 RepID=A0A2J8ADV5_9CHLO|nr:Trafficking protein particle complex subunit 5 [Tetrabaena socialis]|eukprot:PNH10708.1 Trafficking protein particle complex subunit 5 [Tetrabaena socialis]